MGSFSIYPDIKAPEVENVAQLLLFFSHYPQQHILREERWKTENSVRTFKYVTQI
jgi:hypothetical protein